MRLIESDNFPFEFLSQLADRESWRKEVHRPIYHIHKWWAKRLGSVFRGILAGCVLPEEGDLPAEFYRPRSLSPLTVFDPFMGSGTTVGEAHKLGFSAIGRDINPVAVRAVRVALGPMDRRAIESAFGTLSEGVGEDIRALYRAKDARGRACDVLYYFWVMQAECPACDRPVDLFSSRVIAGNAYPQKKPEVQILCPACGAIFPGRHDQHDATCRACGHAFDPHVGPACGAKAACPHCRREFAILASVGRGATRPEFRLYGKLVLTRDGEKEYLAAVPEDLAAYRRSAALLEEEARSGDLPLPTLGLERGFNTRQAMSYGFRSWRDFFNDRQLLALGWLRRAIAHIPDESAREPLLILHSGLLEFNNLFASYKGEGTGAVRHMFSHHILKPERTPIEANVWGTRKSSGSFSGLLRSRLLRAIDYRFAPTEVNGRGSEPGRICSPPFTGKVEDGWPERGGFPPRSVHLSCGDSSETGLPDRSIDLVVTDPPFFDNVHYSELADFFFAWQQLDPGPGARSGPVATTRSAAEVQDSDADRFSSKLASVLRECHRVLKDDGLMVFTYHHSREDGWRALAGAVVGAGFVVVNSHPVKAEMTGATPKSQAREPIQIDIVLVCRKADPGGHQAPRAVPDALASARSKITRLRRAGFSLSRNDRKVVLFGQLMATVATSTDASRIASYVETELAVVEIEETAKAGASQQKFLFP